MNAEKSAYRRRAPYLIALAVTGWAIVTSPGILRAAQNSTQVDAKQVAKPKHEQRNPRTADRAAERHAMVATQLENRGIANRQVLNALRNVPRHWFVPERFQRLAYDDRPLPIGEGQTISQPYIVALMTEALKLNPATRVLEIGTGSGYQAAVLSEMTPHVFTIEIVESLGRRAQATFERRGYDSIKTRVGDGYRGWPEHAPFDAIIVTCAPDHIPRALTDQLKSGGRICIPVGKENQVQELIIVTKSGKGKLERKSLLPVRFVPMTGEAQSDSLARPPGP